MSGHVETAIPYAFSIGRFWYLPRFLFPESFIGLGEGLSSHSFRSGLTTLGSCFFRALERLATYSSYFTCSQARDSTSSMVLHWYFVSFYKDPPSGIKPLLKAEIAVSVGEKYPSIISSSLQAGPRPPGH